MKRIITFSILTYLLFTINTSAISESSNENNLEDSNVLKVGVLLPLSGKFQDIGESFVCNKITQSQACQSKCL